MTDIAPPPASTGFTNVRPQDAAARCAQEPIHLPGSIQPHGALLAVIDGSTRISHASANLFAILGHRAADAVGMPLERVVGKNACQALLAPSTTGSGSDRVHVVAGPTGHALYLHAHRSGRSICIDIEPMRSETARGLSMIRAQAVVKTFRQAVDAVALCELAVHGLKAITGYDRVMAYRFGADGHGEVVAEALEATLEPYLGLHYPASDIPVQARRQYLRHRVGAIADSSYVPVPLIVDPSLPDVQPLDLTHSAVRSVSPVHCEYMRNMQTAASLTIGLAKDGELWGMLVCHHARPAHCRARAARRGRHDRRGGLAAAREPCRNRAAHPACEPQRDPRAARDATRFADAVARSAGQRGDRRARAGRRDRRDRAHRRNADLPRAHPAARSRRGRARRVGDRQRRQAARDRRPRPALSRTRSVSVQRQRDVVPAARVRSRRCRPVVPSRVVAYRDVGRRSVASRDRRPGQRTAVATDLVRGLATDRGRPLEAVVAGRSGDGPAVPRHGACRYRAQDPGGIARERRALPAAGRTLGRGGHAQRHERRPALRLARRRAGARLALPRTCSAAM